MDNSNVFDSIKWSAKQYAHNKVQLFSVRVHSLLNKKMIDVINEEHSTDYYDGFSDGIDFARKSVSDVYMNMEMRGKNE